MGLKSQKNKYIKNFNSIIFSEIYKENLWGGERHQFYSGPGSHSIHIPEYAHAVANFIKTKNIQKITEIGCGDFNVSKQILKNLDEWEVDYKYVGYDVVEDLIIFNKKKFASKNIKFFVKDACIEKVRFGELLLVRQVLQHLNNECIQQIVDKFKHYKYIIITEHQVTDNLKQFFVPNLDKPTDGTIRINYKSGVYLEFPPFCCKIEKLFYAIPEVVNADGYLINASINSYLIVNP